MVYQIDHPVLKHLIGIVRNKETNTNDFRTSIQEISEILFYEATRNVLLNEKEIDTPIAHTKAYYIDERNIVVVPILRAGLGMSEGITNVLPNVTMGHIGLMRDEVTKEPIEYLCKLPQGIEDKEIYVVDPMLATGGSASFAIKLLKDKGAKHIKLLSVIASREGLDKVSNEHNDVDIYVSQVDEVMNENKYIVPGLGDAGDRIFGTN